MGSRARANFHELSYLQARALRFNSVMALRISSLRIGIQFAPLRQLLGSLSRFDNGGFELINVLRLDFPSVRFEVLQVRDLAETRLGNCIRDSHIHRPAATTELIISARSACEL